MENQAKTHNEVILVGRIICRQRNVQWNNKKAIKIGLAVPNDDNIEAGPNVAYVYVYDPNNTLVSKTTDDNAEYYKLTEQGTYRIVYRVSDASGNTTSDSVYSHSFTVNAKTTSAKISSKTLGGILIAASLMLLGGVIIYFFATRKVVRRPKNKSEE